ncbi:MAG: reverse transcriptase domain-containing protein [Treponemataceae bacterium]|nr:reverse transcriptase domain-containing protein [Treponemataceae bacterium]
MNTTVDSIRDKLAKKIYELLVVNSSAIAIQQKDGRYTTCYAQYDYHLLSEMLRKEGSAGCYQQARGGLIKWLCLDFDCKQKDNPPIDELNEFIQAQVLNKLDSFGITYLTEFSGRRGIHVWIIFHEKLSKKMGYDILQRILHGITFDESKFELDKFPATDSAKGNKVGKQVKFPLSVHRSGVQSFLFEREIDKTIVQKSDFWENQYMIFEKYQPNNLEEICNNLKICISDNEPIKRKYRRFKITNEVEISSQDVIRILNEIPMYKAIFDRLKNGCPKNIDWYVLLGTLSPIDISGSFLMSIFSESSAFEEEKSNKNIIKWKDKYFPATISYLEQIYDISSDIDYDNNKTGLEYLIERLNSENASRIAISEIEKKKWTSVVNISVKSVVQKERKYILENDENIVIPVWNRMNELTEYDYFLIEEKVSNIINGDYKIDTDSTFYEFHRIESEEKTRKLIVLDSYDRILTTTLALKLAQNLREKSFKSFSYNPAFLSKYDIFYPWFSSWSRYINKLQPYINIPFLDDWGVFVIDIKNFYDNIDFLSVYSFFKDVISPKDKNIFTFLIDYNEKLERKLTGGRIGVPQGPAYARIVAELFMNKILEPFYNNDNYVLFRYVDDITIFYKPDYDGEFLYRQICSTLKQNGLLTNNKKTKFYGRIKGLSNDEKNEILRYGKLNYSFRDSEFTFQKTDLEKHHIFDRYIEEESALDFMTIIFSELTNEFFRYKYFQKYKKIYLLLQQDEVVFLQNSIIIYLDIQNT